MAGALMMLCGALAGVYTGRLPCGVMVALLLVAALMALPARVNAIFCLTPLMALLVICIIRPRRLAGLTGATCARAFVSLALILLYLVLLSSLVLLAFGLDAERWPFVFLHIPTVTAQVLFASSVLSPNYTSELMGIRQNDGAGLLALAAAETSVRDTAKSSRTC